MRTSSHTPPSIVTEAATFIGIDYHKKYSVWHAVDAAGRDLGKGRKTGKTGSGKRGQGKRVKRGQCKTGSGYNWLTKGSGSFYGLHRGRSIPCTIELRLGR